ncbi:MAG: carboxypeptidase-like regulatory domain-containing protein, partial [Candidatus Sulfotelmatobacter sp.]
MFTSYKLLPVTILAVTLSLAGSIAFAQSGGSSGSITGTVLDPDGAVVDNATVEIHNPVSQFDRSTVTDKSGNFNFSNVPFNPYHMTVTAT